MPRKKIQIDSENIDKIKALAGDGLSVERIAGYLGMSKSTLDRRISENEELKLAIEEGRSKSIQKIASKAYEMALSGKFPSMTMFWLKCRDRWTEKVLDESDLGNINIIVSKQDMDL
jgi:hypothetical protein